MPATILPFKGASSAPALPIDDLSEIDDALTLLTYSLERCADPDSAQPSPAHLAAFARHAIAIQRQFQEAARQVLAFVGHPPEESEFCVGYPAMERLQRAALFGEPLLDNQDT